MSAPVGSLVVHFAFDRATYAVYASARALAAIVPAWYVVPDTIPGGKPLMNVFGLTPRFPMIMVL